ncbi:MAG: hypothetical protein ACK5II_08815 [Paracoccus sp. (in: a-proteobacteria)]
MRKLSSLLLIGIIAGLAYIWFIPGINVVLGGPSKSVIVDITREVMVATAPSPDLAESAKSAKITPDLLCGRGNDDVFGCGVSVEVGGTVQHMITTLRKDDAGNWVDAD